MRLELERKGGNELCVGSERIERGVVRACLEVSNGRLERREFVRRHRLGRIARADGVFHACGKARLERDVDGTFRMSCREPSDSDLTGSNLPGVARCERLCSAQLGHPWQGGVELHAIAPPVRIEDLITVG